MIDLIRRAWAWVTKPTLVIPRPDEIVELTEFMEFQRADELKQLLINAGIVAETYGGNEINNVYGFDTLPAASGGYGGFRVMVRGDGLAAARQVLADYMLQQRDYVGPRDPEVAIPESELLPPLDTQHPSD